MTDTNFTPEDGAEFASLMGINEENNQSEVVESQDLETDGEDVEATESNNEPDNSEEEDEAPQKSTNTSKKKS